MHLKNTNITKYNVIYCINKKISYNENVRVSLDVTGNKNEMIQSSFQIIFNGIQDRNAQPLAYNHH